MKPIFVINCRDKEKHIGRAIESALSQTTACEIIISVQKSSDATYEVAESLVNGYVSSGKAFHDIRLLRCPVEGPYSMRSANENFDWAWRQAQSKSNWVLQLSGDDYSLPDRVKLCMEAVEQNPCSAVATTMFFEVPGAETRQSVSGYPQQSGYVKAGEGALRLAYGSVIAGYSREFLERVGSAGDHTMDVYYGFLAALDKGFYVVAEPQHVHLQHADVNNMGFQGRMRGASGDELARLAELNHFQLCDLYFSCLTRAQELHPEGLPGNDVNAILNMIIGQTNGWLQTRRALHKANITPGILS